MGRDADIVVVGAGITGVATARALAQAGRGVVLRRAVRARARPRIEPRRIPDLPALLPRRALRPARPGSAAELARARGRVRRAADRPHRRPRLRRRSRPRTPARSPPAASGYELLSGSRGARRGGRSRPTPDEQVLFQPDGGTTLADRAYQRIARRRASTAGAVLLDHRARGLARARPRRRAGASPTATRSSRAPVSLPPAPGREACSRGVEIELAVVPTRETVAYFRLADSLALPPVIDDAVPDAEEHGLLRPGLINYALAAPGVGLKAGLHHSGPPADPDEPGAPDDRPSCGGSRRGRPTLSRSSTPSRSRRRRACTRTRPTSPSCSSGTAASSSRPPARVTASSSRLRSDERSPRSPATLPR